MDYNSEEYKRYKAYRDKHYPHLSPCDKCNYWRGASGSHWGAPSLPTCDYWAITGKFRDCLPDFEKKTCACFDPKIKSGRQKKIY